MRERLPAGLRRVARPRWFGLRSRVEPLSDHWGYDRGTPIDRWYIEQFLSEHRADVRGRVLEVKDDTYARRFGNAVQVDVLDIDPSNERATIVADLADATRIPDSGYDCVILTQTLQYVPRVAEAIGHVRRILVPGGAVLATLPCLSRAVVADPVVTDFWRFTEASCRALFGDVFGPEVEVRAYGNATAGAGFLLGYAAEELSSRERDAVDPRFPVVVTVRALRT